LHKSRFAEYKIDFPFFGAPMVGLSHAAFRELVSGLSPQDCQPILHTEMLSTRRIPSENLSSSFELQTFNNESFFVPQLLGNEKIRIEESVQKLSKLNPLAFDINMGCPVSHTLRHNWGVKLMGDPDYAASVVRYTKSASHVPVSVKLRGGMGESLDTEYLLKFTAALEGAGANWITVHPRPRSQKHKGDANWQLVHTVRNQLSIPVIGNGNIQTAHCAIEAWQNFDADGIMIARALTARPWIFWQIALNAGNKSSPQLSEKLGFSHPPNCAHSEGQAFVRSVAILVEFLNKYVTGQNKDQEILKKISFHVATAVPWLEFGHSFWKMCTKCKSQTELLARLFEYDFNILRGNTEFKMHSVVKHL
jgi:tRNA-dihydrouridine synthase B